MHWPMRSETDAESGHWRQPFLELTSQPQIGLAKSILRLLAERTLVWKASANEDASCFRVWLLREGPTQACSRFSTSLTFPCFLET